MYSHDSFEIGSKTGVNSVKQQVGITCVATDGDGDANESRGLQDAMPTVATERQTDTTHLGQTQF